jgi:hypothetical protein
MSSGALSTVVPALCLVETERAFLLCEGRCAGPTWHTYRATREGEWHWSDGGAAAPAQALDAVILHHVFACDGCGRLRVWGASDPERKWRSDL